MAVCKYRTLQPIIIDCLDICANWTVAEDTKRSEGFEVVHLKKVSITFVGQFLIFVFLWLKEDEWQTVSAGLLTNPLNQDSQPNTCRFLCC